MAPIAQRYAEADEMAAWGVTHRFSPIPCPEPDPRAPVTALPAHLANAIVPRRNLCAEYAALPTDKLLAEAEAALTRLDRAGRPTDYAVVVALVRRVAGAQKLDGALWLDLPAREVA